jgi:hypothetical protein
MSTSAIPALHFPRQFITPATARMETLLELRTPNDLSPELIHAIPGQGGGSTWSPVFPAGYSEVGCAFTEQFKDQTMSSPGSTFDSPLASPSPTATPLALQVPGAASGDQGTLAMGDELPGSPSVGAQKQLSSRPSLVRRALGPAPRYALGVFLAITSAH